MCLAATKSRFRSNLTRATLLGTSCQLLEESILLSKFPMQTSMKKNLFSLGMDTLDREAWSPHDQFTIFALTRCLSILHTLYRCAIRLAPVSVACWRAALFLSRSACLLRALTSSLERFLCLCVLTLFRSLRCSSTSIIHQAGEGTTRLGLRPTVPKCVSKL